MEIFTVEISMISKDSVKTEEYTAFNEETHDFKTIEEANSFIEEMYGDKNKKSEIYQDVNGEPVQIGWIYGFWNRDYCQGCSSKKYLEEDWVSISKKVISPLDVKLWK